jgi:hypothetical protein
MKNSFLAFILLSLVFSCKESNIFDRTTLIIGKWEPTNELQSLKPDGTWSDWTPASSNKSLPTYEFTKKGTFFLDNEINESCCNPGSFYKLSKDTLTFTYDKAPNCSTIKCADANTKIIVQLVENELILLESSGRYKVKYNRVN